MPDDFVRVLAPLGRRVGNDEDRVGRGDFVERAGACRDGVERLFDGGAGNQTHGCGHVPKLRIERDRHVAELAERHVDEPARGLLTCRDRRLEGRVRQIVAGWAEVLRAIKKGFERRFARCRPVQLRAELVPDRAQGRVGLRVRRVELARQLELNLGLLVVALAVEPAAAKQMGVRRAELGAIEADARIPIVRVKTQFLRVFGHGQVVVAKLVGRLGLPQHVFGAAATGDEERDGERAADRASHWRISTFFGGVNSKSWSERF